MSQHSRTLAALLGSIGGLVVLATIGLPSSNRIVLPAVEPGVESLAQVGAAFPTHSSQVVVTFVVPIERLQRLAAEATPRAIEGEHDLPDTGGFGGIRISPKLTVEPVRLEPKVGSSPLELSVRTRFQGTVGVSAFKRITIGPLKTQSPRINGTAHVDATINGVVAPGLDARWEFTHRETFTADVHRAELAVPVLGSFDVRGAIRQGIDTEVPGVMKKALDRLSRELPIRAEMEKIWKEMHRPIRVGENPEAQIFLQPRQIRLQSLRIDDPKFLTVRAAVDGEMLTLVGDDPVPIFSPTALPDLLLEPALDPKFRLVAPVGVELDAINELLHRRTSHREIVLDQDVAVTVGDVRLVSKGDRLFVKVDVDARSKKLAKQVVGSIYLKCGVEYDDASGVLRLSDVEFAAETRNSLEGLALWLMNDKICRRIEQAARIDVRERLERLRSDVNTRYASVELVPGAKLEPRLDTMEFDAIRVADNLVILGFSLGGEVAFRFDLGAR